MRRIILASGSPRRKELLAKTGLEFEVIPGEVDEDAVVKSLVIPPAAESSSDASGEPFCCAEASFDKTEKSFCYPAEVVKALSQSKAEAVAEQIPEGIVIGSDTIVWDNEVLGKPADRADAFRMLRQLAGRVHSVYTGVTILVKGSTDTSTWCKRNSASKEPSGLPLGSEDHSITKKHVFFVETKVEVYPMTDREIEEYLDTGEAMDKAGAYGIQGKFGLWVKGIEGDYNSVVGLPLSAVWQVLKEYV